MGQQVVTDVSVLRSYWRICSLRSVILICYYLLLLLMYLKRLFCFIYQTHFDRQHGSVYSVTIDWEFSDVTAFIYTWHRPLKIRGLWHVSSMHNRYRFDAGRWQRYRNLFSQRVSDSVVWSLFSLSQVMMTHGL